MAREASIAIDLVPKKASSKTTDAPVQKPVVEAPAPPPSEASLAAAGVPRRRRGRAWLLLLFLLVAAAASLYFMRERIPWLQSLKLHSLIPR